MGRALLAAPGTMLSPNLRLLRLLGRGGMGSVWLAEHLTLGSEVAVKLLSTDLASDGEALERFRREATAVAQLKSPHVVGIHDFGDADGVPYFVMEQLVGEDLGKRLERVGRLPIGIATAVVVQTCKALARVHELGIVHRDLKPGNIFLTQVDGDLVVKLLDFGVAKTRGVGGVGGAEVSKHETSDQAVLGTPLYMSPEQFLNPRNVGPASDLYSLAVVIYECLAGEPPFDGETVGALHVAIANGRYTPICGVDRTLPLALDGWFERAFASEPQDRFQSAREMSDAFLAASLGRPSFASEHLTPLPGPSPTTANRHQQHPSLPAASMTTTVPASSGAPFIAGVLAVVVMVGVIFGATRLTTAATRPASPPPPAVITGAPPTPTSSSETPAPIVEIDTPPSSSTAEPPEPEPSESAAPTAEKPRLIPSRPANRPAAPRRKNRGF